MSNPFQTEEAWEVSSDTILPQGDYRLKVLSAESSWGGAASKTTGGYPQVEVRLGNDEGSLRDWLVITPRTIGKIVQLFQALGVRPPADDETDSESALAQTYVQLWVGKEVGVIARDEQKYNGSPGEMQTRIRGYVKAETLEPKKVGNSDVTPAQGDFGVQSNPYGATSNDDIPF